MLRRFSSKGRKELKDRRRKDIEFYNNQAEINKTLTELSNSVINYGTIPPLVPNTRHGSSLFQTKTTAESDESRDLDRTLYEMPMPEIADAMTDLLKIHKDGDKFPYVGIVGKEGETLDARRARLLSLKPSIGMRTIPEIEVVGCPLIDVEGEFTMSNLMEYAISLEAPTQSVGIMPDRPSKRNFSISKQYVHIKSVTGLYTPNMSSTSDFCKLWFVLVDERMINQSKAGQSNALVSNQEGVMEMSCDYCVSTVDLGHFKLAYTLEREILKPSHQWGTISFYFNIVESDIPYQTAKRDALTVYRMPITTLTERSTNADKSDISFTSRDVETLRRMYMAGDIVDVDEPQKARLKKSSYSKSTLRGVDKGAEIANSGAKGWEFMKGARKPDLDAIEASIDNGSEESGGSRNEEERKSILLKKEEWEAQQEKLREMQKGEGKELAGEREEETSDSEPEIMKTMKKRESLSRPKSLRFGVQDV